MADVSATLRARTEIEAVEANQEDEGAAVSVPIEVVSTRTPLSPRPEEPMPEPLQPHEGRDKRKDGDVGRDALLPEDIPDAPAPPREAPAARIEEEEGATPPPVPNLPDGVRANEGESNAPIPEATTQLEGRRNQGRPTSDSKSGVRLGNDKINP